MKIARLNAGLSSVPVSTQGYADAIDAETVSIPNWAPSIATGTIVESTMFGIAAVTKRLSHDIIYIDDTTLLYSLPLLSLQTDAPVIFYFSDHRPLGLKCYRFDKGVKDKIRLIERTIDTGVIRHFIRTYVDGVIAASTMCEEAVNQFAPETPITVAEPYILPDIYDDLENVSPSLNSKSVITVARDLDAKGIDLLIDCWPHVLSTYPDAELHIVGPNHSSYKGSERIYIHGYVKHKRLPKLLSTAGLFICPSRCDAYSMAVIEGMRAGLPPIVTTETGSKTLIKKINKNLIVEPTPTALSQAIIDYFRLSEEEKIALSCQVRQSSERHEPDRSKNRYREAFETIRSEVI